MEVQYDIKSNMSSPLTNLSDNISIETVLIGRLGPRRKDMPVVMVLLIVYGLIFISGVVGNICTCIVILRNRYMRTTTNYYLLSLAISDVLILLIGLPSEVYSIWESYPWRFGKEFCIVKSLCVEMTSYASVLTITAFTVERYIAICKPLMSQKIATISRCVKIIVAIWIVSFLCALPYPIHTDLFFLVKDTNDSPIADSLQCNIPPPYYNLMTFVFQISTFVFFVLPLTIIIVLYTLIGLALRNTDLVRTSSDKGSANGCYERSPSSMPRKTILRVLVAVVVAFFVSWAPFHSQRLLTVYNRNWTPMLLDFQSTLFYISGVLYFIGSTVNPILYNVMSRRYRLAFMETICHRRIVHHNSSYRLQTRATSFGHKSCDKRHQHENVPLSSHQLENENLPLSPKSKVCVKHSLSNGINRSELISAEQKHAALCMEMHVCQK